MKRIGLFLGALVMLLGCTLGEHFTRYPDPEPITAEMLTGTWNREHTDGSFTFAADGTFTATFAAHLFNGAAILLPEGTTTLDRIDLTGTWSVPAGYEPNKAVLNIEVILPDHPVSHTSFVQAWRGGDEVWLRSPLYSYVKQP